MWWTIAGVAGALGVALGAFGAHGLQGRLDDPHLLEVWQTASRYHLIHALALAAVAAHPGRPWAAGWLFVAGIIVFSGTLYLMPLLTMGLGGSWRWLGAITPLGGLAFIAGWLALALWPRGG